MTSFISGPILEVQLDAVSAGEADQEVADTVTRWKVTDIIYMDSNNDQNIHRLPAHSFSIFLNPLWISGLNHSDLASSRKIKLQRTFDPKTGTENWHVI